MTRAVVGVQVATAAGAAALLLFAPIREPPTRLDVAAASGVGVAAGVVVFAALARPRRLSPPSPATIAVAVAAAVTEEIVWRWGVVAGARPLLGTAGAFAAGTVGFAFAHVPMRAAQRLPPYLALGAAFGAVFVETGRLAAAIAAHCAYNVLVLAQERQ